MQAARPIERGHTATVFRLRFRETQRRAVSGGMPRCPEMAMRRNNPSHAKETFTRRSKARTEEVTGPA